MHTSAECAPNRRGSATPTTVPAVDIFEAPTGWTLRLDVPGVTREDLSIELEDRTLVVHTLAGEAREPARRYRRLLRVPPGVNPAGIRAHLDSGVLEISLPKPAAARRTRIEVGAN